VPPRGNWRRPSAAPVAGEPPAAADGAGEPWTAADEPAAVGGRLGRADPGLDVDPGPLEGAELLAAEPLTIGAGRTGEDLGTDVEAAAPDPPGC